jgi:hypothetical protein
MKIIFFAALLMVLLVACQSGASPSAQAVENFLQALADKNEAVLLSHACPDYEMDALLEFDSFALVQTTLEDVSCQESGTDGDAALVVCNGSIEASYGGELRSFDLTQRTYRAVESGGNWLVCGYTK